MEHAGTGSSWQNWYISYISPFSVRRKTNRKNWMWKLEFIVYFGTWTPSGSRSPRHTVQRSSCLKVTSSCDQMLLNSSHEALTDMLGWTCFLQTHATQISKEEIKDQLTRLIFNLPPAKMKCQMHGSGTATHDASGTMYRRVSRYECLLQQRQKMLLRFGVQIILLVARVTWRQVTGACES